MTKSITVTIKTMSEEQTKKAQAHMALCSLPKKVAKQTQIVLNDDGTRNFTFKNLNLDQIIKMIELSKEIYE